MARMKIAAHLLGSPLVVRDDVVYTAPKGKKVGSGRSRHHRPAPDLPSAEARSRRASAVVNSGCERLVGLEGRSSAPIRSTWGVSRR